MSAVPCRRHDTPSRQAGYPAPSGLLDICQARTPRRRLPNHLAVILEQTLALAHAQKGAIILNHGSAQSIVVQSNAGECPTSEFRSIYLEDYDDIPRTIIRHVLRTRNAGKIPARRIKSKRLKDWSRSWATLNLIARIALLQLRLSVHVERVNT